MDKNPKEKALMKNLILQERGLSLIFFSYLVLSHTFECEAVEEWSAYEPLT